MEELYKYISKSKDFKTVSINVLGFKETKKTVINSFDVGIIPSTIDEFDSIKSVISDFQEINLNIPDSSIYYSGYLYSKKEKIRFIVPFPLDMGIEAAVVTTTKLLSNFNLKYLFMIGIAAGNKNIAKIGDILISEKSLNYNQIIDMANDEEDKKKKFMHNVITIDSHLKSSLSIFSRSDSINLIFNDIKNIYPEQQEIKCHIGLIATGSSLLRSDNKISSLTKEYHGIVGLDMETYGFYYAISTAQHNEIPFFVSIKSVSDFGDNSKHKLSSIDRKRIALRSSSLFLKYFIENV